MKIINDFYYYKVVAGRFESQLPITLENVKRALSLIESGKNPNFFLTLAPKTEVKKKDDEILSRIIARDILKEAKILVAKR
jgi:hypothetical protein